jgi:uncharacterized protein (TIGR02231 family)
MYSNAEEKKSVVKSKITKVTVYQQGAQIKRKASYSVIKGTNKVIVTGISPNIDPNSIQVTASGNVVLLDSKFSSVYPKMTEQQVNEAPPKIKRQIEALKDSIFELSYLILEVNNKIEVLNNEKAILNNNGTIKGVGKVNDSIPLLKNAMAYYHTKMNTINSEILKLTRKKILLERKNTKMNTRLTNLNNYTTNHQIDINKKYEPIHQIEITLSSNETTSGKLYVSYLVNNAGWIPQYDLRNQTTNNTIKLTYKAQVYQNTGVQWDNVRLSLSTNNPYANKTKPELTPWYLNYSTYFKKERTSTLEYNKMKRTNAYSNAPTQEMTMDENEVDKTQDVLTSEDFTQVIKQLISVEYAIDLPYSIKSNNEKYMVLVNSKTLDTKYRYYTVPKIDLSCYLVAQITNLDDLDLVPGKASIFHNGAYLGTTYLNPSIMNDTMNLSLGKDPKLMVKRTTLKNESKQKVVGDKIVKTYAYHIEVKNHKNSTVKITLQDQIPISQNKEIEIELINGSKGKLNEITGLMEWDLKLKSKETKKIDLVYSIKYDKTQQVNLVMN